MTSVFINFSNHRSSDWSEEQIEAAGKYGRIVDIAFPQVEESASEHEIIRLADAYTQRIMDYKPAAVLCQGEFTLAYSVIRRLRANGVTCLAACSNRITVEEPQPDGSVKKTAIFSFRQFREYES